MSVTVREISLSILAATASDAGLQLAGRWVNERYQELVGRTRTNQLRHYGSVFVPAPITTGTFALTEGSNAIVGTGTSMNANQVGWTIRFSLNWYVIVGYSGGQNFLLDSAISEGTNAASTFQCVKRYIPTVSDARWISAVVHMRSQKKLRHRTLDEMAKRYPSRLFVGPWPRVWSESATKAENTDISTVLGTTGQTLFEVYPPSSQDETYMYTYWSIPQQLGLDDNLPPAIDAYTLREGVLVDVYRYKANQWLNKANTEMAAVCGNLEARQRTVWEQAIQEAIVSDAKFHNTISVEVVRYGDYCDDIEDDDVWGRGPIILINQTTGTTTDDDDPGQLITEGQVAQ